MIARASFLALSVLAVVGCTGVHNLPSNGSLVPAGKLQLFPKYGISYADAITIAGIAALVYTVTDPLAPAWEIIETRLADHRVLYNLRMQNLHLGGEGEARYVLARRAEALAREEGMRGYEIVRYEEAIDSRIFLPHRTATAEIVMLAPKP